MPVGRDVAAHPDLLALWLQKPEPLAAVIVSGIPLTDASSLVHDGWSMEIRRAGSDEARAVASVWLRSRIASAPDIPASTHSDEEVRAWFERIVLPRREVWVAVAEMIIAVLVLEDQWIDQLYVDPEHTGQGIGRQLVDLAKERRPHGLMLWTFQANQGARRFYERLGFVACEYTDGANEEGAPDVRYQWGSNDASGSRGDWGSGGCSS